LIYVKVGINYFYKKTLFLPPKTAFFTLFQTIFQNHLIFNPNVAILKLDTVFDVVQYQILTVLEGLHNGSFAGRGGS